MLGSLWKQERRAIQATAWGSWGDDAAVSWAGAPVTNQTALQLLTVYGCNRFISDGIATLPVDTFRDEKQPDGKTKTTEVPKARWLEEPAPGVDPIGWHTQNLTSLLMAGNTYLHLDYTDAGLTSLLPLDPGKVTVVRPRGRKLFHVANETFDSTQILHIPGVMFPGSDVGMSPVEAARQTIGAGLAVTEFAARFFGQGAVMSGVIEDPGPLDPQKAKETARIWGRLHGGKQKAHLPGVLQGGASWKPTGVTNEQAQFLQTRGFTSAEIASFLFLIDPSEFALFMGQGGSITYANLEQRNARKVQVTFLPWIVRLEKAFSSLLPRPRYVKFNVDALLRADTDTRYKAHAVGIQNKFMTPNEARALENLPPLPGGDAVVVDSSPKV